MKYLIWQPHINITSEYNWYNVINIYTKLVYHVILNIKRLADALILDVVTHLVSRNIFDTLSASLLPLLLRPLHANTDLDDGCHGNRRDFQAFATTLHSHPSLPTHTTTKFKQHSVCECVTQFFLCDSQLLPLLIARSSLNLWRGKQNIFFCLKLKAMSKHRASRQQLRVVLESTFSAAPQAVEFQRWCLWDRCQLPASGPLFQKRPPLHSPQWHIPLAGTPGCLAYAPGRWRV